MIEASHGYRGLYYVLMGRVAPLEGIGPRELDFQRLLERASDDVVQEVILATNFTAEGETTAHFLNEVLAGKGQKLKPLARGVPAGGALAYVDDGTPAAALSRHQPAQPAH